MLFVALWLWLDQPWLWALAEALALTYGLWVCGARGCRRGGRGEPRTKGEPAEQSPPPPLGERGRRLKKPKDEGAEDTGRAQGEEAAAEAPARAAGTEDSSHFSQRAPSVLGAGAESDSVLESGPSDPSASLCHPPSEADPRASFLEGSEARGRLVVEAREWLGQGKDGDAPPRAPQPRRWACSGPERSHSPEEREPQPGAAPAGVPFGRRHHAPGAHDVPAKAPHSATLVGPEGAPSLRVEAHAQEVACRVGSSNAVRAAAPGPAWAPRRECRPQAAASPPWQAGPSAGSSAPPSVG